MNSKKWIAIFSLTLAICISSSRVVKAGVPTTGASVRGSVHFEGKIPPPKAINMAADPFCARQHPTPATVQEVMADSKGDLENVIVFVSDGLGDRTFDP